MIDFLTEDEAASIQPFLAAYERVRSKEEWGGDDLDLPFHPKRHLGIWAIRQRTFRAFQSIAANVPREIAVDVGAGNCWMTRYLDRWGFDAIAVDINSSKIDGLRAGQKFIDEGDVFLRICARMERLPFASGRIRLLAINACLHYATDLCAVLAEFERVLSPGGIVAIIDTPFYEDPADGERMMAERVVEFRKKHGIAEAMARKSSYMTYNNLQEVAGTLSFRASVRHVWPGLARRVQEIRGKLVGRRVARFPLVVLQKSQIV